MTSISGDVIVVPEDNPDDFKSLNERLILSGLKQGRVRFYSLIRDSTVATLQSHLDYIADNLPKNKNITIHLFSPGGDLCASLALYDYLRELKKRGKTLTIVAEGICASAACMVVLQAADVRVSRPHTRFLLHELRSFKFGTEKESDALDETANLQALSNSIRDILAERCGKRPADVYKAFRRRENWMGAKEALKWGLVDKVE